MQPIWNFGEINVFNCLYYFVSKYFMMHNEFRENIIFRCVHIKLSEKVRL